MEGGLRSLTKNRDRSLVRDGASGMHEDRFTCMGGGVTSVGWFTSEIGWSLEDGCTSMEGGGGMGWGGGFEASGATFGLTKSLSEG